jgi:hypothetical protein
MSAEPCGRPVGRSDTIACADYKAHQADHIRHGDRWRCLVCEPLAPIAPRSDQVAPTAGRTSR